MQLGDKSTPFSERRGAELSLVGSGSRVLDSQNSDPGVKNGHKNLKFVNPKSKLITNLFVTKAKNI